MYKYIIISFLFFGLSCRVGEPRPSSPGITPSQFGHVLLKYDKAENHFRAEASFESGSKGEGQSLEMKAVRINGLEMKPRLISNRLLRYELFGNKRLLTENELNVIDASGQDFNFNIDLNPVDSFYFKAPPSKSKGALLSWSGDPLVLGELVVAILTDKKNQTVSQEVYGPKPLNYLPVLPVQLQKLDPGPIEVYLIRKSTSQKHAKDLEVLISAEYNSNVQSFILSE